jgi:hypothetical protein
MASRYRSKCNYIYAHKKSATFPATIVSKLTNAQLLYLQAFSPKLDTKCGQYGQKLIYAPQVKYSLYFPHTALPSAKRRQLIKGTFTKND